MNYKNFQGKYFIFLSLVLGWILLIFLAPVLKGWGFYRTSGMIYYFFSIIDHQIPERSFFIFGEQLGVCVRCTAIYVMFFVGSLLYPFFIKNDKLMEVRWLVIFIMPLLVDGFSQLVGLRESTNTIRVITGILAGIILPFYIIPGYLSMIEEVKSFINNKDIRGVDGIST
tara:strand:+ start:55841 stop:56350 length:510 start_codon:yes stop_codon:yes gene_type:complete